MYLINKEDNRISSLQKQSFSSLGFREREHLQEWIANNPECLGEELLIIQKEFAGFSETNERLDLLAIDKQGNLVIIENKLDDSGRDVTWQAIKYASYCSNLSKAEIIKIYQAYLGGKESAEENISEFMDGAEIDEIHLNQGNSSQRMILVAAKFRKEVTSSVLWLLNHQVRLQCFKATPYILGEQTFLNVEQLLPVKDLEEFSVHMANKAQEEVAVQESAKARHKVRLDFWEEFLSQSNQRNTLFSNSSPSKANWLGIGMGLSGVSLYAVVSKKYARSEIYFNRGRESNKELYDLILPDKEEIESVMGSHLMWERLDNKVSCRVKSELTGVNLYDQDDWPKMIEYLIDVTERIKEAFKEPIKKMKLHLNEKNERTSVDSTVS